MTKEKKNPGGRPPRYEGEKSERIGALIRPRYKHAIELISRDRGMTQGEVIELALSRLVDQYIMTDGKPLVSFVKPKHEVISRLLRSISFSCEIIESYTESSVLGIKTVIKKAIHNTPKPLRSNFEMYQLSVIAQIGRDIPIFDFFSFYEALEEAWREGVNTASIAHDIKVIGAFYDDVLRPAFLEANPTLKERLDNNAPPDEQVLGTAMNAMVYPFDEKETLNLFLDYSIGKDPEYFSLSEIDPSQYEHLTRDDD